MECTIFKADGLFKETSEIVAVQTPYGPINHTLRFNPEIHEIIDAKPPKKPGARWNRERKDWDYPGEVAPLGYADETPPRTTDEALAVEVELALQQDAAKPDDVELFPPAISQIDKDRAANARLLHKDDDLPAPGAPLSDWDMDGQGVVETMPAASNVPPEIAALLDEGETLTRDVRRKLTERLNVELAELKNLRGLAGEDLKREAEIEKLLGLFARLGEI